MQHAPAGANRIVGTVGLSHSPIYKTCRHGHSQFVVSNGGNPWLTRAEGLRPLVGWVVTDTDFREERAHDVGTVPRAVHPAVDDLRRARLAERDILAPGKTVIARRIHALAWSVTVEVGMAKKVAGGHVQ